MIILMVHLLLPMHCSIRFISLDMCVVFIVARICVIEQCRTPNFIVLKNKIGSL